MALSEKFINAYRKAKQNYPDEVIFLAQGIFYRALDEDAKVASELCELKLMSEGEFSSPIPVCGFPQAGLDKYVGKMVRAGKRGPHPFRWLYREGARMTIRPLRFQKSRRYLNPK